MGDGPFMKEKAREPFQGWDHRWSSGSTQTMNIKTFSVWWLQIMKHRFPGHSLWPFWDGEDVTLSKVGQVTSNYGIDQKVTLNHLGFTISIHQTNWLFKVPPFCATCTNRRLPGILSFFWRGCFTCGVVPGCHFQGDPATRRTPRKL